MSTSSSIGALYFTGISQYSSDFQSILTRAQQIGQLPIQALQNQQSANQSKEQALTTLDPTVAAVGSAVASLGTLAANGGLSASSSDSGLVTATTTGSAAAGSYTVSNIKSLASAASEMSLTGYANTTSPVSSSGYVNLVVGSRTYQLNITHNNNLSGLVNAINNSGAGATASILTTGTGTTPDYLVVTANSTGSTTLQLNDLANSSASTGTNLVTNTNQGSNADFFLNGIEVTRTSNTINDLISGVSITLNDTTTSTNPSAILSVSTNGSQLAGALQNLVTSYNALVDAVNQQRGQSAGALNGDSIVWQISSDMQQLATYWNPGSSSSIHSLSDLGIEFDDSGKMSFNQNTFNALSSTQIADAYKFLGSSTSGLGALANNFTQITDPIAGLIQLQLTDYQNQDTRLTTQIADAAARATATQNTLTAKVQAADALCAQLQSEQNSVTAEVQSLNYVLYGYQQNPSGVA